MEMADRTMSLAGYRYGFNGKEKDPSGEWGSQAIYDYGFRIYNPGLGKFLSVDPLTQSYPWYTPYQFAGNKPIMSIDLDGLEEKEVVGDIYKLSIDMKPVPKVFKSASGRKVTTSYNLHGYGGNNLYFWEKFIEKYPHALDDWNKGRVLVEGLSPRVTKELKDNFKNKYNIDISHFKSGEVIDHHHVGQKSQAVPLSRSEHKKIPTFSAKDLARRLGGVASVVAEAGNVAGFFSGNPESWYSYFDNSLELGKIKKETESGLYYTPVSIQDEGDSQTVYFSIYASFQWDKELKKYVGTNIIGHGYKYEEKGGYSLEVNYNLEGKPTKLEEKGTRTNYLKG